MASSHDTISMALFCDFENVALGVRDAKYDKFDIKRVLERLLLKGSIVVKKAYCDWDRYKGFKATMHEASFELIEIPHVRQSGKNSADIRLVVDALDLCYTKSHVNTFVIISGDSDFSPLVSKLRENAKQVIGVGVKQSTSDLLIANCDEFIFYDDLVRESQRAAAKQDTREAQPAAKRSPDEEKRRREEQEARKTQAVELAVETFDALVAERGDSGKIWASLLKEAIKRRKPGFNESYYGFRAFGNLLEEAQARGLLELGRDEKSGAYVYRHNGPAVGDAAMETPAIAQPPAAVAEKAEEAGPRPEARRRTRGGRKPSTQALPVAEASPGAGAEREPQQEHLPDREHVTPEPSVPTTSAAAPAPSAEQRAASQANLRRGQNRKPARAAVVAPPAEREFPPSAPPTVAPEPGRVRDATAPRPTDELPALGAPSPEPETEAPAAEKPEPRRRARGGRKPAAKTEPAVVPVTAPAPAAEPAAPSEPSPAVESRTAAEAQEPQPARKPPRTRRPRKPQTTPDPG